MKPIVLKWQESYGLQDQPAISHMLAASTGEAMACLIRVPTEVIKTKMQTNTANASSLSKTFQLVLSETHGSVLANVTGGLYRGYGMTLMREIPFAAIQFPLYEHAKVYWGERQGSSVNPVQAAACGSLSGAIAAGLTTPLDVVKTRLMLGADRDGKPYQSAVDVVRRTLQQEGTSVFWSGVQPRVMWISIGGFVFFGAYEGFKKTLKPVLG
jgi:solute carrier family 25 S-adenosylmethionine transporter 26